MIEVTIHPAAEAECETALAWYYERSPEAAERFEAAFGRAIGFIRANPTILPLYDDRHRFVLLKRYLIAWFIG